ncbi:sugar phosphotransferase [Salinibacterium hongtaonis]|uniref:Sugar phosphotransferase n=2 Tax=Homoserinimonas hongtaonis TaxID=2079791 RepID=A0A2U1T3B5_9MICO|nr:sugar phosphotransferase [Salinibacterium hongtaonis]PWB98253.1 sugar phosphotransferase [Salinibacterium hongtaonis]
MNVYSPLPFDGSESSHDSDATTAVRDGHLTIVNTTLTPWQARWADLEFVRGVLDRAAIDFFLVRSSDHSPVVVVDFADRDRLARALADACRTEPFYSRTEKLSSAAKADLAARGRGVASGSGSHHTESVVADSALFSAENNEADARSADFADALHLDADLRDTYDQSGDLGLAAAELLTPGRRTVLLAEGRLSRDSSARAFTLYRPREAANGRLRYGAENGVALELWEHASDRVVSGSGSDSATLVIRDVIAPRANLLLRHRTPEAELVRSTVSLHGRPWPTLQGMFEPTVDEVTFDIDMVFSWVDGSSLEFQRARARRLESYVVGEGDDHEARFRQLDELRYALRSIYLFAPWVRNIYIATDSPRPSWLAEHPRVTLMRSEAFFADTSVLPTHNSHAVESQLHNIEGLSEHFLYSNDDMFFGRPVSPEMFFSSGGVSRFIQSMTRIGVGDSNPGRSGFENAARVNRALLEERFGVTITRHLEHAATPLRRSVMRELEAEFPDDFARTAAAKFRQATDVSVTNSLYHYYAEATGRAVPTTEAKVRYVDTTAREGVRQMKRLLKRRNYDFFCLNDGSFPELDGEERARAVRWFLERYFPIPAPWELPDPV